MLKYQYIDVHLVIIQPPEAKKFLLNLQGSETKLKSLAKFMVFILHCSD